jgi:predicted ferric reductase
LEPPTKPRVRSFDLAAAAFAVVAITTAMWVRHGGVPDFGDQSSVLIAIGQLAALYGTLAVLTQLVFMSRAPWIERVIGQDRLAAWHRWVGFATLWLLVLHAGATAAGYGAGEHRNVVAELWHEVRNQPDVLASAVGLGLFVVVAVTSVKMARRALAYETWFFVHLYAYLAIALSFAHQFAVGTDFSDDRGSRLWWVFLYVVAVASMFLWRLSAPINRYLRHRWTVAAVVAETDGVVSLLITGRQLDRLRAEAGQYFLLRFLTKDLWWEAHPFSLSAAPNTRALRFTVKVFGDGSRKLTALPVGTKVMLEGPYGVLTGAKRHSSKTLLVAGGVGITPLRALFEQLPGGPGDVTMIYRCRHERDFIFREELDRIAARRGFEIHYLSGRRAHLASHDPFHWDQLRRLVPDIAHRDVYVCGPSSLMSAVEQGARAAGVPAGHIHAEKFGY